MFAGGESEEIARILSARTMVVRNGAKLKAVDYTEYFKKEFSAMANELEVAAHYCSDDLFREFLSWQAQALLQNNEDMDMLADKHWAMMQDSPLEFTISRENYDDEMTPTVLENQQLAALIKQHNIDVIAKDMLGARVGIVNREGTKLLLQFRDMMPKLSALMPYAGKYAQSINADADLKQTMPRRYYRCSKSAQQRQTRHQNRRRTAQRLSSAGTPGTRPRTDAKDAGRFSSPRFSQILRLGSRPPVCYRARKRTFFRTEQRISELPGYLQIHY